MSEAVNPQDLQDYHWLVSSDAIPWLERAAETVAAPETLLRTTNALRRDLGPARGRLAIELVQLRSRAKTKFCEADRMFFTRQLLEQATDDQISGHKSGRFAKHDSIADLCCGIGGDLLGFARVGQCHGIDCDEIACLLAKANCDALGLNETRFTVGDATQFGLADFSAWHLDPDRRPAGKRTTRLELHHPDLDAMEALLASNNCGAIKLAPAAEVPADWAERAELEWIGNRRECRQQVAWFGGLADRPGQRVATVFTHDTPNGHSVRGSGDDSVSIADAPGRFVYEPHAAVIAAGLTAAVAGIHNLDAIASRVAYLTGDVAIDSPEIAGFEVIDVLPFNIRRLKKLLRNRGIGRLEVKKRGTQLTPERILAQLAPKGDNSATLLVMPRGHKVLAMLCQRLTSNDNIAVNKPSGSQGK